jgi:23S rRNA (uracil1939-C5)-methyltransferase
MVVRVEQMVYGGAGTGRDEHGAETAVPFSLPGELVQIETGEVLEASSVRVHPRCRHFGVCGGCQYQHVAYDAQVEIKRQLLHGILTEAGLDGLPEIEVRTADPWGYRNRIRLRVKMVDEAINLGYSRRASNDFLAITECPISAPDVWQAAEAILQLAEQDASWRQWLERATEVEIFAAIPDSGEPARIQLSFFLRDAEVARREPFAALCERLKAILPELTGAAAEIDPELGRRVRRSWDGAVWGAAGLVYPVGQAKYWVTRGAFFQVNRFLLPTMLELATAGRTGALAWDLFAGVGLFSKELAARLGHVVAVEGNPVAAADLARLAKNVRAVESATADFLRRAVLERDRPDLIVMDPPRAGVGTEPCNLLARIAVPAIVYVSCDPLTLARDLAVLTRAGYVLERVVLLDMFPQTFHLETIVWLRRSL